MYRYIYDFYTYNLARSLCRSQSIIFVVVVFALAPQRDNVAVTGGRLLHGLLRWR